jgi:uncharacterized protein YabE (DUF348 family)
MKNKRFILGVALLICSAAGLTSWMHKSITIDIDGVATTYQTWSLTVGSALAAAGIPVGSSDQLQPSQNTILKKGQVIVLHRAHSILVQADGKVFNLLTANTQPEAWLDQLGITLVPGDNVVASGFPIDPLKPYSTHAIQVLRQQSLILEHDGISTTLRTNALTIGSALWEVGIRLRNSDIITPPINTTPREGMVIHLDTARLLRVRLAGSEYTFYSAAKTVGMALAEAGLALQGLDYTVPSEAEAVPEDGNIHLVRVREETVVHESPLPFKTTYQPVDDLEIDNQKIVQAGLAGIEATRERVRYEDGVETSRQSETNWVARKPQDRIIGYGTMIVRHTLSTPDGTITYWRALKMWATSYRPSDTGGEITASGLKLRKGLVGVDPRYIPYFTQMYVPGYGKAMAADTGGGIQPRMIDLAYSNDEYVPWHQYVTVYFLWPPPAVIIYQFP